MITVYTIAYNEQFMLPYFIKHYRKMFPDCKIVVYDNESTDATVDIARYWGCEVITYKTNNQLSDSAYLAIKNSCWLQSQTDWVLIADVDEHCYINADQLAAEMDNGVTLIKFQGFNMVNHTDNMDLDAIIYGVRAPSYDKNYLFDRSNIDDIKHNPGAHTAKITGHIVTGHNVYTCRHYKYVNVDYMIARHGMFAKRLSEENKQRGYGGHYLYTPDAIRNEFRTAKQQSHVVK